MRSVVAHSAANIANMRQHTRKKKDSVKAHNSITCGCSSRLLSLLAIDLNVDGVVNYSTDRKVLSQ